MKKDDFDIPLTVSVPVFGREVFDCGKNAAYAAAKRGEILTIPIGNLIRVPLKPALRQALGDDAATDEKVLGRIRDAEMKSRRRGRAA